MMKNPFFFGCIIVAAVCLSPNQVALGQIDIVKGREAEKKVYETRGKKLEKENSEGISCKKNSNKEEIGQLAKGMKISLKDGDISYWAEQNAPLTKLVLAFAIQKNGLDFPDKDESLIRQKKELVKKYSETMICMDVRCNPLTYIGTDEDPITLHTNNCELKIPYSGIQHMRQKTSQIGITDKSKPDVRYLSSQLGLLCETNTNPHLSFFQGTINYWAEQDISVSELNNKLGLARLILHIADENQCFIADMGELNFLIDQLD